LEEIMSQPESPFLGTYFEKDGVLRLVTALRWLSWILLAAYVAEWAYNTVWMNVTQSLLYGYSTDWMFLFLSLTRPLQGGLTWAVLQAIGQGLLILMDIEDNTRRAARAK
jgi:hypothetical protein